MATALIESIEAHFNDLGDLRRKTENKCHHFIDIFVIALCGTICGANHWTGIPSHDTFNDVFAKIDAQQFEKFFVSWVESIANLLPDEVVSVDGKT